MRIYLYALVFVLHVFQCFSQSNSIDIKRITAESKLSNSWIRSVYQDDAGFIWVGTNDGLSRYNGYEFRTYQPKNKKSQGLGNIAINAVLQKSDHELWVCSSYGLYVYDYTKDELIFDPLLGRNVVSSILKDHKNNIWLGTQNGLYMIDNAIGSTKTYIQNPEDPNSLSNNFIKCLYLDSDNHIWVGTKDGLNQYQESKDTFIRYEILKNNNLTPYKDINGITQDQQKRLWIGTAQNGIYLLENKSKDIKFIDKGFVVDLIVDSENILWIGMGSGGGLKKIDLNKFQLGGPFKTEHYTYNSSNVNSLSDDSVFRIYEDNTKDIWIGTFVGGLNYYSKREKKFFKIQQNTIGENSIRNNLVNALFEEEDYLWIGTEGGLDRYDKKEKTYRHFIYEPNNVNSLGGNPIFTIYKDSRKNLWVGTWGGGLNLYDYETETFERFLPGDELSSISNSNVFGLKEDRKGNLWVATIGGGLNKYNYDSKTFIQYRHDKNNANSIYDDYVDNIYELANGDLYLVSFPGLQKFDYKNNIFHKYPFNHKYEGGSRIIAMYQDSKTNIWVATNVGLYLFDQVKKTYKEYGATKKLENKTIQAVLEDDKGNIWISTNNGIYEIMNGTLLPEKTAIHHFTELDGLAGNEFKRKCAFKNTSGKMYFGSSSGITSFYPDSLTYNTIVPKVALTEFQLLHSEPNESKKYKSTAVNINAIDNLDLSYKESDFIIKYTALNYLHPEKNRYQYKLEGYDNEWIDSEGKHAVTYTNIQPGTYTFMVKGSNNDNIWSKVPKSLKIKIHPPWWGTFLFKFFAVLAVLCILILIYLLRVSFFKKQNYILEQNVTSRTNELVEKNKLLNQKTQKIAVQNKELESHRNNLEQAVAERTEELMRAKVKAEESEKLKSSFMANMSHEIRTPMNAIYGFSDLLKDDKLTPEERSKYIEIVKDNCDSLLLLIDNILDISMIEANHLVLHNEEFDFNELLKELEVTFNKNIPNDVELRSLVVNKEKAFFIYNDKTRVRQIITNLISNAIKFTDKGEILFGYEIDQGYLKFYISDTGIGIDKTKIDTIFDPFYKIEGNENKLYSGIGIGLAICKRLIAQLKGKIWVASTPNKGSTFYFTIAIKKEQAQKINAQIMN